MDKYFRYDPNYDLLKKPASHYSSSGTNYMRYHDHTTYQTSPNTENMYITRNPQSPPQPSSQQQQIQTKRPYDSHNLSLPLMNTITDRLENNPQSNTALYSTNAQSPYFDNRQRNQQNVQQARMQDIQVQDQIYEQNNARRNPFLADSIPVSEIPPKDNQNNRSSMGGSNFLHESGNENRLNSNSNIDTNVYNRDTYGELNMRQSRSGNVLTNDRLILDRRTPDAYGRSPVGSVQMRSKVGDYEDIYSTYSTENEHGRSYTKPVSPPQALEDTTNYVSFM